MNNKKDKKETQSNSLIIKKACNLPKKPAPIKIPKVKQFKKQH